MRLVCTDEKIELARDIVDILSKARLRIRNPKNFQLGKILAANWLLGESSANKFVLSTVRDHQLAPRFVESYSLLTDGVKPLRSKKVRTLNPSGQEGDYTWKEEYTVRTYTSIQGMLNHGKKFPADQFKSYHQKFGDFLNLISVRKDEREYMQELVRDILENTTYQFFDSDVKPFTCGDVKKHLERVHKELETDCVRKIYRNSKQQNL